MIEEFRKKRAELWKVDLSIFDAPLDIVEMFEYNWHNKISLFEYQGKWGYCLRVWTGDVAGVFYGPFFSFCDPYPSRFDALAGAVDEFLAHCEGSKHKITPKLIIWARSLITPQQLKLI